jgi:PAS domain S-box-containing protein
VASQVSFERRLLVLAPTGRDAPLTRAVLSDAGVRCTVCRDLAQLLQELDAGAGALLISEEALALESHVHSLGERLGRQPPWSDLPILLLAHPGADSSVARQLVRVLGNVTLIERPVRVAALLTTVQAALRARQRQYNAREHLADLDLIARALKDSESRLKALFDNAAVGIAELTAEGRLTMVNDAICRLLGDTPERLLAMPLVDLAHPGDREGLEKALTRLFAGETDGLGAEKRFVRRDGAIIWANLTVSLARMSEAGLHGVAIIEDVTERKQVEEDLREADRRKDEFLATLAHELRNPLAPIRNSLHILGMSGVDESAVKRVTEMMTRQVAHMVRMVDDLLEVSRISRGKIELRKERVELAAVLRNAVDTSLPLVEAARHRLAVNIPAEPLTLEADPVRLAQVFANLLNNAAKYTPDGGEIAIEVSVEAGMASVCVRDNGEGIPPAMLARVFNMFTQVNTGSRAQGGLGIGLTLARTLVQLHGGTIEAFSDGAGKGCQFLVRLPLAPDLPETKGPEQIPAHDGSPAALKRVLVVDDNRDAADSLGMLLEFLGADVRVVHDGPGALEAIATFQPAVVLLDLGMPGMSGLEVARRMREDPRLADTKLVALTGWGQREDRRRTHEAGFDYHLVKPADVGTLRSILSMKDEAAPSLVRH